MTKHTPVLASELPHKRYRESKEISKLLGVSAQTLAHWRKEFPMLRPSMRSRRWYYRQEDSELLCRIHELVCCAGLSAKKALTTMVEEMPEGQRARWAFCLDAKAKPSLSKSSGFQLGVDLQATANEISRYGGVTLATAKKYVARGECPYAVGRLVKLQVEGRVLPDSWNHCFINGREKLEMYQVGEVSEEDISNFWWLRQLRHAEAVAYNRRIRELERELEKLQMNLDQALSERGYSAAANDPAFHGRKL